MSQKSADLARISAHLTCRASAPWSWVFYGDSITHGAAYTRGWRSFPEIFAEFIRWEKRLLYDVVINTGIAGQTTRQLLNEKHYDWRVRRFNPDVVFLLIGINDIVKLQDPGKFRTNLQMLVGMIRRDNAVPVLQTYGAVLPPPEHADYILRREKLPEYNQVIRQLADEESLILIDHELYWQTHAGDETTLSKWLGEPIHPGARGHLEMAKLLLQTLNIYDPASPCCNPPGI